MCFFRKRKQKKEEEARRLAEEKARQEEEARLAREKAEQEKLAKEEAAKKPVQSKTKKAVEAKETAEVEEKARKAVYRVVFDKESNLWKIKKDGAKRVIGSTRTKEEALARVQKLAQNQDASFVVSKKDGKFQKKANLNLKKTKAEE